MCQCAVPFAGTSVKARCIAQILRKDASLINKDYILRLAERIGRELSILLGLRKRDEIEEGLITTDNLLMSSTGLTSRFINALSEEMLLQSLSPLGRPNIETL